MRSCFLVALVTFSAIAGDQFAAGKLLPVFESVTSVSGNALREALIIETTLPPKPAIWVVGCSALTRKVLKSGPAQWEVYNRDVTRLSQGWSRLQGSCYLVEMDAPVAVQEEWGAKLGGRRIGPGQILICDRPEVAAQVANAQPVPARATRADVNAEVWMTRRPANAAMLSAYLSKSKFRTYLSEGDPSPYNGHHLPLTRAGSPGDGYEGQIDANGANSILLLSFVTAFRGH